MPSVGPEIIANYSVNSTAIYVEWNHTIPEDKVNGILVGYRVWWNDDHFVDGDLYDSKGFIDVWLNNTITTNYTITSLHKYWLYKVRVAGRTSVGHGTYTQVLLRTDGDGKKLTNFRGCLHDTGATFIPVQVHSASLLWLCIRLHDISTKSHTEAGHTGASSPLKLIPMSCKRGTAVRFGMKSLSWESRTDSACAVFDNQSNLASQLRRST